VLSGLARFGSSTAARLAAEIGLDRSRVSRHADRFEAIGWLRREADPADARGTLLILTPRGHEVIAALRAGLANHLGVLVADWPAGLAESLVDGLRRLTDGGPGRQRFSRQRFSRQRRGRRASGTSRVRHRDRAGWVRGRPPAGAR